MTDSPNNSSSRFIDNGDGTVTDHELGLMWKVDDSHLDLDKWLSWAESKNYIEDLKKRRFAGHADWRMPTRKEAQSIYDPSTPSPTNTGTWCTWPRASGPARARPPGRKR